MFVKAMKVKKICFVLAFTTLSSAAAQDTIRLLDKTKIGCRVIEIKDATVDYKLWGELKKEVLSIEKNKIHFISYNTGAVDTLNRLIEAQDSVIEADTATPPELMGYNKGYNAGFNEYKDLSAMGISGLVTGVFGIFGITAPIVYSVSNLKPSSIVSKSFSSSHNEAFKQGYLKGAKTRRKRYAWTGFAIGEGVRLGILVAIIAIVGL